LEGAFPTPCLILKLRPGSVKHGMWAHARPRDHLAAIMGRIFLLEEILGVAILAMEPPCFASKQAVEPGVPFSVCAAMSVDIRRRFGNMAAGGLLRPPPAWRTDKMEKAADFHGLERSQTTFFKG
jgi:hypothetical protein